MPKLTNHKFTIENELKQAFSFNSEVFVDKDGEFSCTVPDYLVETLNLVAGQHDRHRQKLYTKKLAKNIRAYAPSKSELISFVEAAHNQFYQAEVTTDLIICYDYFAEVSYWQNPDGSIAANGAAPGAVPRKDDGTGGEWAMSNLKNSSTTICATNTTSHYSVGLFAGVYKRKTYTRVSGVTVKWERINQFSGRDDREWLAKLTGFCGIHPSRAPEHMKQMPYSDEAAKFFYDMMISMCEIGRQFNAFFGDQSNVLAAIAGTGPSLLAAPGAEQAPAKPTTK